MSGLYKIEKDRSRRTPERPDQLIICHDVNLINTMSPISNVVRRENGKYTWGIWQKYCMTYLDKLRLPMHYFYELLNDDYACFMGLDEYKPSFYIQDMINFGVIQRKFYNSLLIVPAINLEFDQPSQRFYDQLVMRLMNPLFHRYNMDENDVYIWDECLTEHFMDNMSDVTDNRYEYHPMDRWNYDYFKRSIDKLFIRHQFNKYF